MVVLVSICFSFLRNVCVGFIGLLFVMNFSFKISLPFYPLKVILHVSSSPMILFIMETTIEIELLGLWQNGIHLFWVLFWFFH